MNVKQRMKEVLDETINYYDSPEKFGYSDEGVGGCVYWKSASANEEPVLCAVGRCLRNPFEVQKASQSIIATGVGITSLWHDEVSQQSFKDEYQGLPVEFWGALQTLHDQAAINECYSIKDSFETLGMDYYNTVLGIIENYDEGVDNKEKREFL